METLTQIWLNNQKETLFNGNIDQIRIINPVETQEKQIVLFKCAIISIKTRCILKSERPYLWNNFWNCKLVSIFISLWNTEHQKQPLEVFSKISQNLQKNTCARVSFWIKLQAFPYSDSTQRDTVYLSVFSRNAGKPATLLIKNSGTEVFLWILRNFKNTFFIELLQWLLRTLVLRVVDKL